MTTEHILLNSDKKSVTVIAPTRDEAERKVAYAIWQEAEESVRAAELNLRKAERALLHAKRYELLSRVSVDFLAGQLNAISAVECELRDNAIEIQARTLPTA
ncbi:MAG: hypothetical protein IT428_32485 [Planctomycetaceae bacterium]|nr:hypothetical protein [Planctomycetaceae bacterium]